MPRAAVNKDVSASERSSTEQRYVCDRPGCSKRYSRQDHLSRHKLNHKRDHLHVCKECNRSFFRRDLLARHLKRHEVLGYNFRMMRKMGYSNDSSFPAYGHLSASSSQQSTSRATSQPALNLSLSQGAAQCAPYPPQANPQASPDGISTRQLPPHSNAEGSRAAMSAASTHPGSDSNVLDVSTNVNELYSSLLRQDPQPRHHLPQPHAHHHEHTHPTDENLRLSNAGIDTTPTTSTLGATLAPADSPLSSTLSIDQYCHSVSHSSPAQLAPSYVSSTGPKLDPFAISAFSGSIADYNWLFDDALLSLASAGPVPDVGAGDVTRDALLHSPTGEQDFGGQEIWRGTRQNSFSSPLPQPGVQLADQVSSANRKGGPLLDNGEFFTSLLVQNSHDGAHYVDGVAYGNLLDFLSALPELATSPYFTQASLQEYSNLFFAYFNSIYPLIHHGTFSASRADPMLLSAIVICGSYYSPHKEAHDLAIRISGKLWGALISADFEPARATLQMLQAMMLTEAFGKFMSTRPQHETAHLFHNFVITLARRNALFLPAKSPVSSSGSTTSHKRREWGSWVQQEERKRAAFFAFILDAQHANTFRHVPSLSSFEIHLRLPCDEELWEARTEQKWSAILNAREKAANNHNSSNGSKPPHFIAALKAILTPDRAPKTSDKDAFSEYILLHGLMSVSYNLCFKRDIFLTANIDKDTSESFWDRKARLRSAYGAWKLRLDLACHKTLSPTADAILRASDSMIVMALIALHSDQIDILTYVGLPSVLGRLIDRHNFLEARLHCRQWAQGKDAYFAAKCSANFLKWNLLSLLAGGHQNSKHHGSSRPFDELLHHRWALYHSALILWTLYRASRGFVSAGSNQHTISIIHHSNDGSRLDPASWSDREQQAQSDQLALDMSTSGSGAGDHMIYESAYRVLDWAASINIDEEVVGGEKGVADVGSGGVLLSKGSMPSPVAVLILVERVIRGCRWQHLREANDVLLGLIRQEEQNVPEPPTMPASPLRSP